MRPNEKLASASALVDYVLDNIKHANAFALPKPPSVPTAPSLKPVSAPQPPKAFKPPALPKVSNPNGAQPTATKGTIDVRQK